MGIKVSSPQGVSIEFPDGTDAATIDKVMRQATGMGGAEQPEKKKAEPYKDWGSYGKDLARTALGQGTGLGFGDEIVAGVRSTFGSTPYPQALKEERDAVSRFREQNPVAAISGELAGGIATPLLGAGGYVARGANLLTKSARSAAVGAGVGATAAVGAQEGNDLSTYLDSIKSGAIVGGGVGAALPGMVNAAQRTWSGGKNLVTQAADSEKSARLYLADRMQKGGVTQQQLADDLIRGQQSTVFTGVQAELPETIADIAPAMQRVLRGVKVGGAADDVIEPFLAQRQSGALDYKPGAQATGQQARLAENTRLAMGLDQSRTSLADDAFKVGKSRKEQANNLFTEARAKSEPFDLSGTLQRYNMEAMKLADPVERRAVNEALEFFNQRGQPDGRSPKFPVNDIDTFHSAKMALDTRIRKARIAGENNAVRLLTNIKHDLMHDVFQLEKGVPKINATYRKALDDFSSKSALLNAKDLGLAFAKGREEITPRMFEAMSEGEKRMIRKAKTERMSREMGAKPAGPTVDFTSKFRSENTAQDFRMLLPEQFGPSGAYAGSNADNLADLVGREQRMSQTTNKVLGNSSTAEKAVDAIDLNKLSQMTRYIKDSGGVTQAVISSISDAVEKMTAIKGEKARYLAKQLLETDPKKQAAFLKQVADEYGEHQAALLAKTINGWSGRIEASAVGVLGRGQGERSSADAKRANTGRGLIGLGNATR